MTQEIFKDIEGYEGLYHVSNLGRVKSLNYRQTHKQMILKPAVNRDGYFFVYLCKNSKRKMFYIHRLVAQEFIPNPNKLPEINHKDEIKTNNNIDNIEWCTHEYNSNYGTRNERISKMVLQYDKQGNFIREYPSAHEIQRQLGYSHVNISNCCRGELKYAYGYVWKYKN